MKKVWNQSSVRTISLALLAATVICLCVSPTLAAPLKAAVQGEPPYSGTSSETTGGAVRNLLARIETDRTQYPPGRGVEITLSLTNQSGRRVVVSLPHIFEYDIIIRSARTNRIVYQWSKDRDTPPSTGFTLEPDQVRTNREFWDGRDNNDRRVPAGAYKIEARIYPQNSVSVQVYLQDRPSHRGGGGDDDPAVTPPVPSPGDSDNPNPPNMPIRRDPPFRGNGGGAERNPTSLEADLQVDRNEAYPGEPVRFTYTVHNSSGRRQVLRFSTARQSDFEVRRNSENYGNDNSRTPRNRVWAASDQMAFVEILTQLTLNANESRTFTAVWTPRRDASAGSYAVSAFLTPIGGNHVAAATASIRLLRKTADASLSTGYPQSQKPASYRDPNPNLNRYLATSPEEEPQDVTLEDLLRDGVRYKGRRVLLMGIYKGNKGGIGAPPVHHSDWVLGSGSQTIYVSGTTPQCREGDEITVTGTVRATRDRRIYVVSE